ncbi:MAG: hypothetical protein NTY77_00490 [Elusimicrobia bacterium]|nr:hypothetical protein [Elusimicrobiota bacterium]
MATKSPVAWLVLAFALAVPGVLFYQWYTHLDLEKKRALTTKVRLKDTDLFRNSPKQDKLVNPIAPVAAPVVASTAAATAASTATATAAGGGPVAAAAPPANAAPAAPVVRPAPEANDPNVAIVSTAPAANPYQAWRDPTLSPHDLVEIERLELEKQLALEELKDRALNGTKAPPKAPPVQIEKLIDLQGIVSVEGGNKAIVNNEVVAEGEVVKTKSGPVKVLRITLQKVIFSHKNKTFFKAVNR